MKYFCAWRYVNEHPRTHIRCWSRAIGMAVGKENIPLFFCAEHIGRYESSVHFKITRFPTENKTHVHIWTWAGSNGPTCSTCGILKNNLRSTKETENAEA